MSNINIRPVNLITDRVQVVAGMKDFISRMNYCALDLDFLPETSEELIAGLERLLTLSEIEVLVADCDGIIVGGIGMIYAPCMWNLKILNAEELFWWAARDAPPSTALRLLRRVNADAIAKGCKLITFKSLTSSPDAIDKVYRKMGLIPIETTYVGVIE